MDEPERIFDWIDTGGGPHIVLPEEALAHWEGSEAPSAGRVVDAEFRWRGTGPATGRRPDYDRACDVESWIGAVPVGLTEGLVLGGEPTAAVWVPHPLHGGPVIVRVLWAEDDASITAALDRWFLGEVEAPLIKDEPLLSVAGGRTLVLFDAAEAGAEAEDSQECSLGEGEFLVRTRRLEPDAETSLILHDFEPANG